VLWSAAYDHSPLLQQLAVNEAVHTRCIQVYVEEAPFVGDPEVWFALIEVDSTISPHGANLHERVQHAWKLATREHGNSDARDENRSGHRADG
jgi:hypothetical protein